MIDTLEQNLAFIGPVLIDELSLVHFAYLLGYLLENFLETFDDKTFETVVLFQFFFYIQVHFTNILSVLEIFLHLLLLQSVKLIL
jgi:hypothetical protein